MAVAADRRLDAAGSRTWPASHEREVATVEPPLANEHLKPLVSLLRACDHEQPRSVAVKTVDNPGALRHVPARDPALEQGVHEGPVSVPCRGMDDDSGRLVHDEEVLVLVRDFELSFLGLQAAVDLVWNLEFDDLPALEAPALGPPLPGTCLTGRIDSFILGSRFSVLRTLNSGILNLGS